MLKYRLISGTLLVLAVVALTIWASVDLVVAFLMAVAALATLETVALVTAAGMPALKWTTLLVVQWFMAAAWIASAGEGWVAGHIYWIMPGLAAWAVFLGCLFRSDQRHSLEKVAGSFLAIAYPSLFQFFILILYSTTGDVDGRLLLVYGILVVKCTDIGAYFTGRFLGRHKLIPIISPAKTWEGVLGGVATAVVFSVFFLEAMGRDISGIGFTLFDAVALPLLLAPAGVLGDLVESMIKRNAGEKDSGDWIKGMGGVLDVVDSPLFAMPMLYVYLQWMLERHRPDVWAPPVLF